MYGWTVVVKYATKLNVMFELRTRCGLAQAGGVMDVSLEDVKG